MPKTGKKMGRPAQGDEVKLAPLNMRTSPKLRAMIEEAATATGRSLTQEVETRLWISFNDDAWMGTWRIKSLVKMLGMTIEQIEHSTGKKWTDDRKTWEAVSIAAERLLRWDRPPVPPSKQLEEATDRLSEADAKLEDARKALSEFRIAAAGRMGTPAPTRPGLFGSRAVRAGHLNPLTDEDKDKEQELIAAFLEASEEALAASAKVRELMTPTLNNIREGREIGNKIADDWFERIGPKKLLPSG